MCLKNLLYTIIYSSMYCYFSIKSTERRKRERKKLGQNRGYGKHGLPEEYYRISKWTWQPLRLDTRFQSEVPGLDAILQRTMVPNYFH